MEQWEQDVVVVTKTVCDYCCYCVTMILWENSDVLGETIVIDNGHESRQRDVMILPHGVVVALNDDEKTTKSYFWNLPPLYFLVPPP